jgi:hypothetical protein
MAEYIFHCHGSVHDVETVCDMICNTAATTATAVSHNGQHLVIRTAALWDDVIQRMSDYDDVDSLAPPHLFRPRPVIEGVTALVPWFLLNPLEFHFIDEGIKKNPKALARPSKLNEYKTELGYWRHFNSQDVRDEVLRRLRQEGQSLTSTIISNRSRNVAKELYERLSKGERAEWATRAREYNISHGFTKPVKN